RRQGLLVRVGLLLVDVRRLLLGGPQRLEVVVGGRAGTRFRRILVRLEVVESRAVAMIVFGPGERLRIGRTERLRAVLRLLGRRAAGFGGGAALRGGTGGGAPGPAPPAPRRSRAAVAADRAPRSPARPARSPRARAQEARALAPVAPPRSPDPAAQRCRAPAAV